MKITQIHQIELSSECNLRCKYCVHPTMSRPKQNISLTIYKAALEWVRFFRDRGTQGELNLAGIGESTLHPHFGELLNHARDAVGFNGRLFLTTNGVALNAEHVAAIKSNRVRVSVSLHRPEKAKAAVDMLRKIDALESVSIDPAVAGVDWAGQVSWTVQAPKSRCLWLAQGWAFVDALGGVRTCCFDGSIATESDGHLGSVFDDLQIVELTPYSLCKTCHQY